MLKQWVIAGHEQQNQARDQKQPQFCFAVH